MPGPCSAVGDALPTGARILSAAGLTVAVKPTPIKQRVANAVVMFDPANPFAEDGVTLLCWTQQRAELKTKVGMQARQQWSKDIEAHHQVAALGGSTTWDAGLKENCARHVKKEPFSKVGVTHLHHLPADYDTGAQEDMLISAALAILEAEGKDVPSDVVRRSVHWWTTADTAEVAAR